MDPLLLIVLALVGFLAGKLIFAGADRLGRSGRMNADCYLGAIAVAFLVSIALAIFGIWPAAVFGFALATGMVPYFTH